MLSIETILGEHILKRAVCPYLVPHIVSGRCVYMMYHSSLIKPVRSLSSPATQSQWPMAKMGRQKIKCVKIKNTLSSLDKQRCHKLINLYSLKKGACTLIHAQKKAMLPTHFLSLLSMSLKTCPRCTGTMRLNQPFRKQLLCQNSLTGSDQSETQISSSEHQKLITFAIYQTFICSN